MTSKGSSNTGNGGQGISVNGEQPIDEWTDDYPIYLESNNQGGGNQSYVDVGGERVNFKNGVTKDLLDHDLMVTMLKDVRRNSYTGEVGTMVGNPLADLRNLYESRYAPWSETFESYRQFERYYEENMERTIQDNNRAMREYLENHQDRNQVTAYGWLNGAYND